MRSTEGRHPLKVSAWVLPQITSVMSAIDWQQQKASHDHSRNTEFPHLPGNRVDAPLGLNAVDAHTALEEVQGNPGDPIARLTPYGWVCFGPTDAAVSSTTDHCALTLMGAEHREESLDNLVTSFWELEKVGIQKPYLTPADEIAENLTNESLRNRDGRFVVGISWVHDDSSPHVTSNLPQAHKRFQNLERALQSKPAVRLEYSEVLKSYLEKEYIRAVPQSGVDENGSSQWYLPHSPVVRTDKSTTKVRIVFDASATFGGGSLNDQMYTGRKTQSNLVHVLLWFCVEPVALVGDISQMFLQVLLRKEDRPYFRFLWRESPDAEVDVFEFQRTVFGAKASPYLAGKVLLETAKRFGHLALTVSIQDLVDESFYVDDLLSSFVTAKVASAAQRELQVVLHEGGFHARKWLSNSAEVLADIPENDRAANVKVNVTE